jgi:hypothetical protein
LLLQLRPMLRRAELLATLNLISQMSRNTFQQDNSEVTSGIQTRNIGVVNFYRAMF